MELIPSLELLAEQTVSGVAFVTAYGLTWLVCGILWRRTSARTAAYATLFQGMVAFPLALGGSALIGAIGQGRPVAEEITQLSILIGTSQLLGLPLLILFVVKRWYTLVPVAFATLTSMHFVLYSWLYRTPVYIVLAIAVAVGAVIVMATAPAAERKARDDVRPIEPATTTAGSAVDSAVGTPANTAVGISASSTIGAARVCILTGSLLMASAAALGVLYAG
ncbi:DUF7010 family protein [Brevibacterium yomogidense]|uniref:Uncharacterized protein n=1 Tax=Brevibacterium yomogidense TaxID=946573 RepID=A0A1X6WTM1_9MICO|nr:hypothetical protein [Brevibacterium yomogidense]SLM88385.1 hypothetical protein FM105_00225 [Brevibacterium yomogidense]